MDGGPYVLGAGVLVFLAEFAAGRHRGIYRRDDVIVTLGCQIVSSAVTRPLASLLIAWVVGHLLPGGRDALAGVPLLPATLAVLLVNDLAFYWGHRLSHESKNTRFDWFWKLHRTHHSAKYLNVTVTMRVNPFWSFVVPTTWVLGLATYLGLGQAAAITLLIVFGWNLITHSHFRWDDRLRAHPLTRRAMAIVEAVIVTPGIHHTHHGYGRDGKTFRNYAVMFSFIDRMFGTLHVPVGRPAHYGLPGANAHWAEETLFPVVWRGPEPGTASDAEGR